jgi:hypothetical protein
VIETKQHISLDPESLRTWQENALEHIRYEYDLKPESIVVDLGAYRGEWANEMHKRYGCMVVVVEPIEYINDFGTALLSIKRLAPIKAKYRSVAGLIIPAYSSRAIMNMNALM